MASVLVIASCADRAPTVGTTAAYVDSWTPGGPAISPSSRSTDPTVPAITRTDVESYVRAHGVGGKVGQDGPAAVEAFDCMDGAALRQRHGQSYGQPDNRLLCLATVKGRFRVWGPPGEGTPVPAQSGTAAIMLFDARTGNILVIGCCP
jgi:hypothetical protein